MPPTINDIPPEERARPVEPPAPTPPAPTPYVVAPFPPITSDQTCGCGDTNCSKQQERRAQEAQIKRLRTDGGVAIYIPYGVVSGILSNLAQAIANGAAVHGIRDIGFLADDRTNFARGFCYPIVSTSRITSMGRFATDRIVAHGDRLKIPTIYFNYYAPDGALRHTTYPDVVVLDGDMNKPFALIESTGRLKFTTDAAGLMSVPPRLIEAAVAWYVKDFDYGAIRYAEFVEARNGAIQQWIDNLHGRIGANEEDIARWSASIETTARAIHETVLLIEGATARAERIDPKTEWDGIEELVAAGVIKSYELIVGDGPPYLKVETPVINVGGLGTLKTAYEIRIAFADRGENNILVVPHENGTIDIGRGYYHPHVTQRGTICWGGYATEIVGLHHAGRYANLIARICAFLVDYNEHDAYQRLRKVAKTAAVAETAVVPNDPRRHPCMDCGSGTRGLCEGCGESYCGCGDGDTECRNCRDGDGDGDRGGDGDDDRENDDDEDNDNHTRFCTHCNNAVTVFTFPGIYGFPYCSQACRADNEPNASACSRLAGIGPLGTLCGTWTDRRCEYLHDAERCLTIVCNEHRYCLAHTAITCASCKRSIGLHEERIGPDGTFCSDVCLHLDPAAPLPAPPQPQEL